MQECLNTVLSVDGCQRAFWGTEKENPATLRWMVDWDSVDSHKAFMKAPYVLSCPVLSSVPGGVMGRCAMLRLADEMLLIVHTNPSSKT